MKSCLKSIYALLIRIPILGFLIRGMKAYLRSPVYIRVLREHVEDLDAQVVDLNARVAVIEKMSEQIPAFVNTVDAAGANFRQVQRRLDSLEARTQDLSTTRNELPATED